MTRTVADFPVGLPVVVLDMRWDATVVGHWTHTFTGQEYVVVQSNWTHPQCVRPDALLPNPGGGVL